MTRKKISCKSRSLLLVFLILSFYGCSKDESLKTTTPKVTSDQWSESKAKAHPYSIENIMEAQKELGGTLKSAKELKLYKYVCFRPDTAEQRVLMQDTTIKLYNLPLADPKLYSWKNHESLKSALEDTTRKPQYAILPLEKALPDVNCTLLDTLYFPDYDTETDLYFAAHILAGTIKVDSAAIDSMPNLKSTNGWGWLKKAAKWAASAIIGYEPTGTLTVNNSPIEGAQVDVIAWGLPWSGKTDANGKFHIYKNIHIWSVVYLTFANSNCNIKLWNLENLFNYNNISSTARYYIGDRSAPDMRNMRIDLGTNSYGGMCATIINAVEKYHKQASELGIGTPPKVYITAIWGKNFSQGSGSAPMLNYFTSTASVIPSYFRNYLKPILGLTEECFNPFKCLIPDIIIPATKGFEYNDVMSATLHELTHAAHAQRAGREFWLNVVIDELTNQQNFSHPYGKSIQYLAGFALAEVWGHDVENYMMYRLGADTRIYLNNKLENAYNKSNSTAIGSWLPRGLFFDLFDSNGQFVGVLPETSVTDNVSGITWSAMYNNMAGADDNLINYKKRLKSIYPSKATDIQALFSQYGLSLN